MKQNLKKLISKLGYKIYKTKLLPKGIDLALDVNKRTENSIKIAFDVGANIGQTALDFYDKFPEAEIFSFEPVTEVFETLQHNTQHLSRVQCFNTALGNQQGQAEIFLQESSTHNSMITDRENQTHGRKTVELTTVDSFAKSKGIEYIDLLKTDTEGYDLEVLKGADGYLSEGKISFILSEVGFDSKDSGHTFFPDILNHLNSKEFQLVDIYGSTPVLYLPNRFGFANALFMKNELAERWCKWQDGKWKVSY